MKKCDIAAAIAGCMILCVPVIARPQEHRGPSTSEERKQILETIHEWQSDPLVPQAKGVFGKVLKWFADVPDLTVHVCTILDKLPKGDKKDASTIFGGEFMRQAAFVVEYLDKKDNLLPEYQAGVEGALHTYELLLKSNSKDRQLYLDDLVQRRDAGTLADFVKEGAASSCRK
jgi:hypothetical protein